MKFNPLPPAEVARALLSYDPETGVIRWRLRPASDFKTARSASVFNTRFSGKPAGSATSDGYRRVFISGECYQAHRLAWLIYYGIEPECEIDHINGIRSDNRIINLRDVARDKNTRNSKLKKCNTSGLNGVSWCSRAAKWQTQIRINGRARHLGYFSSKQEAYATRKAAEKGLDYSETHGVRT